MLVGNLPDCPPFARSAGSPGVRRLHFADAVLAVPVKVDHFRLAVPLVDTSPGVGHPVVRRIVADRVPAEKTVEGGLEFLPSFLAGVRLGSRQEHAGLAGTAAVPKKCTVVESKTHAF